MKFLFILNSRIDLNIDDNFLSSFDRVVCVDGGANQLYEINKIVFPDYICGDFDSIDDKTASFYKAKSVFIKKNNQDESDFFFAFNYLNERFKIDEVTIVGAIGDLERLDHIICNVFMLDILPNDIRKKILTKYQEIHIFRDSISLEKTKGKTISIVPIAPLKNIVSEGFKWNYSGQNIDFPFVNGISNIAENDSVFIKMDKGVSLLIVSNNIS